jgi:hypothetical protein
MKTKRWIFIVVLACCSLITLSQTISQLSEVQKEWLSKANRQEKNGWIYIHIEGNSQERGFQHGYLLANEIKESIRVKKTAWEYNTATEWSWILKKASEMYANKIDSENLAELGGIVEGAKFAGVQTSKEELIVSNSYYELLMYWWPTVKDSISPNSPVLQKESCSAFIATGSMTENGKIVIGHNTWDIYYSALNNVIMDLKPEKGHRIFMQSGPGLIHSFSDFFMTDAGLVGCETTIADFFPYDPNGIPEFVRVRRAMQDASSIDEWCAIMLKGNNGGYANSWLIGDVKTNEIARLELGLKYYSMDKKTDGYFVGSNLTSNLKILRRETRTDETNIKFGIVSRKVRWNQLMDEYKGKININNGQLLLSDHFDTYLKTTNPGSRTICGHFEFDNGLNIFLPPYIPAGCYDGKIADAKMVSEMSFFARWGSSCGTPFCADKFLNEHPQYEWMKSILNDRPTEPWTLFKTSDLK